MSQSLIIFTDGAARGNPGPASCGAVLADESGRVLAERAEKLGVQTNNIAEYRAIALGLRAAGEFLASTSATGVRVYLDSKLACEQLSGRFKVKNPGLQREFASVKKLEAELGVPVRYFHIPREKNAHADRLANEALDGLR